VEYTIGLCLPSRYHHCNQKSLHSPFAFHGDTGAVRHDSTYEYSVSHVQSTYSHPLDKLLSQIFRLWNILNTHSKPSMDIAHLVHLAFILEDHIQNLTNLLPSSMHNSSIDERSEYHNFLEFYKLPELHPRSMNFSSHS
jgi:hypothetical protein